MKDRLPPENDLDLLRALCDEGSNSSQRLELLHSLEGHVFVAPEHQVVFESISFLFEHGGTSPARLRLHLNNRGFPDVSVETYFPSVPADAPATQGANDIAGAADRKSSQRGFSRTFAAAVLLVATLAVVAVSFARPLREFIRESFMQRATSAHYEIFCPPGAMSAEAMRQFASQRESLFASLDRKLDDAASNSEIRIVFYPDFSAIASTSNAAYEVTGTTIRTQLTGTTPQLNAAADAAALLHIAWGNPGNPRIGEWAARWLVGTWRGQELGMAAVSVEQRLGHQTVSSLLNSSSGINPPEDRVVLGAAWLSEIAELEGPAEVRKLYSSKMGALDVADVTKTLGTTPMELDRKWQMWMYAYLAGMPSN